MARVALVTAAPGIGKSRFLQELVAAIPKAVPDSEIWHAEGDAARAQSPYAIAGPMVRSKARGTSA